jgi:hypothetical protein
MAKPNNCAKESFAAAAFLAGRLAYLVPQLATHHPNPTCSNLHPGLLLHKVNYTR